MKSKHRHELKTNELAEWINNFPQWAKENLIMIICVSIVAILAIGVYIWKRYEKNVISVQKQLNFTNLIVLLPQRKMQILQAQTQGLDTSYNLLEVADRLQNSAQNTKNDRMAALAFIKEGDVLRMELHYRFGTVSKQDSANQIEKARSCYAEAITMASGSPSLMARAKFGLGLCEEELGNFVEARQIYSDIAANSDFEATTAAAAAKRRLDTMTGYQQKVVFKKSSEPTPESTEAMQSQIRLQPSGSQDLFFEPSIHNLTENDNSVNLPDAK